MLTYILMVHRRLCSLLTDQLKKLLSNSYRSISYKTSLREMNWFGHLIIGQLCCAVPSYSNVQTPKRDRLTKNLCPTANLWDNSRILSTSRALNSTFRRRLFWSHWRSTPGWWTNWPNILINRLNSAYEFRDHHQRTRPSKHRRMPRFASFDVTSEGGRSLKSFWISAPRYPASSCLTHSYDIVPDDYK